MRISVYLTYLKAFGYKSALLLLGLFILFESMTVVSKYWLTRWTSDAVLQNLTALPPDSDERFYKNVFYAVGYGGISIIEGSIMHALRLIET